MDHIKYNIIYIINISCIKLYKKLFFLSLFIYKMTKIKEFLKEKLHNFKIFISDQMYIVRDNDLIKNDKDIVLVNALDYYYQNIESFIGVISLLNPNNIDESIKGFLSNYEINIDEIKHLIEYDKLKRYIEMFIDLIKK